MAKTGRKSLREEIDLTRRYADLSEKAFRIIGQKLDSKNKREVEYALDWLKSGFSRMVQQQTDITSGGKSLNISISEAIAKKNDINPSPEPNSGGPAPV